MAKMTGLTKMAARGQSSMRNDTAMTGKSQDPQNKDPEGVTPGPQYQQEGSSPLRVRLPKALESDAHRTGKKVMHLAEGHHVKNDDGTTDFHIHALDGEPISQEDAMPNDSMTANSATGPGIGAGSPYGVAEALKGLSM